MPRLWMAFVLAAAAATLWFLHSLSLDFNLFGWSAIPQALHAVAWTATALFVVFLAGQLILRVVLAGFFDVQPSGLQRGIVFSLLTFAATAAVLARFGVDVGAILTTSALFAALVGLAMRPTIGGLIAGSTLNMDRSLRVGDAILRDGHVIEVMSLNWRSITGRKSDGATVILPNATISDNPVEILPGDRPVRTQISLSLPAAVEPQRVSELINEIVSDFAQIDMSQPITVAPANFEIDEGRIEYTVRFWVRHYSNRARLSSEVLRRIWYAFQREKNLGANLADELRRLNERNLRQACEAALRQPESSLQPSALIDILDRAASEGEFLLYAPGERIVLPDRTEGGMFLLVDGTLRETARGFGRYEAEPFAARNDEISRVHVTRRIALEKITDALARYIGPYAEYAVQKEAAQTPELDLVCEAVASEIDDPAERETFLREAKPKQEPTRRAGFVFGALRDVSQSLVAEPPMRAIGGVTLLTLSADAFSRTGPQNAGGKPFLREPSSTVTSR